MMALSQILGWKFFVNHLANIKAIVSKNYSRCTCAINIVNNAIIFILFQDYYLLAQELSHIFFFF